MNAIELLKADHKAVDKLFQQVEATDEGEHAKIFEQIKSELDTHTHIEETILYPALKQEGDEELKDLTLEAIEEHHGIKIFLREIAALSGDSEKFEPKLTVLIENTRHHVMEEEGEMFKMIEEQFEPEIIEQWGEEMETEKAKFAKSAAKGG